MKRHLLLVPLVASGLVAAWLFSRQPRGFRHLVRQADNMNGAESLMQTVVASDLEVSFENFGTTEVPLVAAFDSIGGPAAAPLRC